MNTSREQFEIMRKSMEEEHAKDLAALERLKRFLPSSEESGSGNAKPFKAVPPAQMEESAIDQGDGDTSERPTLISSVLSVLQSNPNTSMTGRHVLAALEAQGFPLVGDERRRLTSIGQALSKLADREPAPIRVVRRGKGKAPNLYRAFVSTLNPAQVDKTSVQTSSEMTM